MSGINTEEKNDIKKIALGSSGSAIRFLKSSKKKKVGIIISILILLLLAIIISFTSIVISEIISSEASVNVSDEDLKDLPSMITKEIIVYSMEAEEEYGVPTSVTLAQCILESRGTLGEGYSELAYYHNNLFGIKGRGTAGKTKNGFKIYNNFKESVFDHGKLLTNSRYSPYTSKSKSPEEWIFALVEAGYCPDKGYAETCIEILYKYNLQRFDGGDPSKYRDGDGTATGTFIRPCKYTMVTSEFSKARFHPIKHEWIAHTGIDLSAPTGTPIYASDGGIVTEATYGFNYGAGNTITIDHGNGYKTKYKHIRNGGIKVLAYQKVDRGQLIGEVGSTGYATGSHLHFEILKNNEPQNPRIYLLF